MSKPDGGPAFPVSVEREELTEDGYRTVFYPAGGMSLRDWFTGQALKGLIPTQIQGDPGPWMHQIVRNAYLYADAMLAEREK
jgi:hypothetical protein